MAAKANKELIRKLEEAYQTGKLDDLESFFAPDFVSHSGIPGMPSDAETIRMVHGMSMQAMPDRTTTIQDVVAEGDKVALRVRMQGTNTGGFAWFGAPANGATVDIEFMSIYRVKNGKIVEHWGVNDGIAILTQLGVWQMPAM